MAEYINRETFALALIEKGQASKRYKVGEVWELNGGEIREVFDSIQNEDVQPVKHGKWMFAAAFPHHVYCSACHKTYIPDNKWQVWVCGDLPRDYCPNCGAKMEEQNVRKSNKG